MIAEKLRTLRRFIVFLPRLQYARAFAVRCSGPTPSKIPDRFVHIRLRHRSRHRDRATRLVAASQYEWDPSLRPGPVRGIFSAERPFEPRLVAQNPPLEPHCASNKQDEREPRPESNNESRHENEVAEIHRIPRIAIWARLDDPVWHGIHASSPARKRQPVIPHEKILQIAPCQERSAPRHHRQSAAVKRELQRNDEQREIGRAQ